MEIPSDYFDKVIVLKKSYWNEKEGTKFFVGKYRLEKVVVVEE